MTGTSIDVGSRRLNQLEEMRDAYVTGAVEDACAGCYESPSYDRETFEPLYSWHPVETCPVHGRDAEAWWTELNAEPTMDRLRREIVELSR